MSVVEYSEAFKAKMVRKMLPPNGRSANALSVETGLSQPTLSRWLREAGNVGGMSPPAKTKKWTASKKLRVVAEAMKLDDKALGELLRREALHEATLEQWRADAEAALAGPSKQRGKSREVKRIQELERDLRRKDRALAEASALLVLKKKASAIWGDEDDDTTKEIDS